MPLSFIFLVEVVIWEDEIKMDLERSRIGAWNGLMWLRIGTGIGLL